MRISISLIALSLIGAQAALPEPSKPDKLHRIDLGKQIPEPSKPIVPHRTFGEEMGPSALRGNNDHRELGKSTQSGTSGKKSCAYYYMKETCSGPWYNRKCHYENYNGYRYCVENTNSDDYWTYIGKGDADAWAWDDDFLYFEGNCNSNACSSRTDIGDGKCEKTNDGYGYDQYQC